MKNRLLKKASKMLLIPTVIIGGLTACAYNNNAARNNMSDGTRPISYDRDNVNNYDGVRRYATDYNNVTTPYNGVGFNQRVAERVADVAEDVPGVSQATAIVYGNDIVVGIDATNNKDVRALERKVQRIVKNREPGCNVHVTADDDINTRIQSVYTNMNNYNTNRVTPRHPMRDLGTDVTDIIRDIGRTVTAPFR
ncbi:YhcN/YlaJ family sporulation lipoprotein [Bacillus alveayuensis]|uniref:YhcN/YlaJ family sporulation lipoprotein n=1 Tax=Aeribacillus alveayuensis TaxID=279215 RepID=UPI0005CDC495|nr:YhcN/YlaJ family sporulation lipoprotein [Bacillus alveayuensis]